MSSFTRQAIMDAFLRLLKKRPFSKITVRDIVEECGVNRTTFYYYYQDIYAIVEDLFFSVLSPFAKALFDTGGEERRDAADFLALHRTALIGLWQGLGEKAVRRYALAAIDGPMEEYMARSAQDGSPKHRETGSLLLREALLGYFRLLWHGELEEDGREAESLLQKRIQDFYSEPSRTEKGGCEA